MRTFSAKVAPLFTGHIRIWFAFLECSHFIAIFAMSFNFLLLLNCTTKVSEIVDMANPWQLFVAQILIKY